MSKVLTRDTRTASSRPHHLNFISKLARTACKVIIKPQITVPLSRLSRTAFAHQIRRREYRLALAAVPYCGQSLFADTRADHLEIILVMKIYSCSK